MAAHVSFDGVFVYRVMGLQDAIRVPPVIVSLRFVLGCAFPQLVRWLWL